MAGNNSLLTEHTWERLRDWYRSNGRHEMPWRHRRSPWSILIAETMLRRTNATSAATVFPQILREFPCPAAVLERPEKWRELSKPLGISRRAELFINACKMLVEEYESSVPSDMDSLLALPGVGHYAASAVRCFGFEIPEVIVDTNTIRIVSRLGGKRLHQSNHRSREVREEVVRIGGTQSGLPADDNFALLDLASIICKPQHPLCTACPLTPDCATGRRTLESKAFGVNR